jgi:uncharacterized membrane protein
LDKADQPNSSQKRSFTDETRSKEPGTSGYPRKLERPPSGAGANEAGDMEQGTTPPEHEPVVVVPPRARSKVMHFEESFYCGPYPPPELLKDFENAMPGAGDRIFKLMEGEAEHRREMEKRSLEAQVDDRRAYRRLEGRGQFFGFAIGSIAILSGAAIIIAQPTAGAVIAGALLSQSGLVTLIGAFLYGKHKKGGRDQLAKDAETEQEKPDPSTAKNTNVPPDTKPLAQPTADSARRA